MSVVSDECVPVDDVISGLTPEQIEVGGREAVMCGCVAVCDVCSV